MPTGIEAYIQPRELRRVCEHALCDVWEGRVDVAMHAFLVEHKVNYTSVDPVRIGIVDESDAPVIIWVRVEPGSLSSERGIEVAVGLRAFLLEYGIEDVHVEIRESVVTSLAKLYRPALSSNTIVQVREPFSTTLGITICAEQTPHIQGTATFFFTVGSKPGKLFLLAAKHVLFRVDEENEFYKYHKNRPRRNVLLLGTNGFEASVKDIEKEIGGTRIVIDHLKERLALADNMQDPEEAQAEREDVRPQLNKVERAINELERFLVEAKREWANSKKRIIGHVVLSPPLVLSDGNGSFTQDFAIIEVDTTKIDINDFVGNAIDLGTEIPVETLTAWMYPHPANLPSFKYPANRLLQFHGTLSDDEIRSHNPKNVDKRGDPTIMVLKRGYGSGLTTGCVNNIRPIFRKAFKTKPEDYSREVAVLPRTSKSGAFSKDGDSGAAVISGWGAVAGMLTGGAGISEATDITYVTPIAFLLERLEALGFPANIFPVAADVVF